MRIGINALLISATQSYRNAGISHYTLNLLNALGTFGDAHEYTVFISERGIVPSWSATSSSTLALVSQTASTPARSNSLARYVDAGYNCCTHP